MYAVIETGGKQYRVAEGEVVRVELLTAEVGNMVELDRVVMVSKDGQVKVGKPVVDGAKAVARVLEHGKGPKILAFRYKAKKNVRVRRGHRQPYTALLIEKIEA